MENLGLFHDHLVYFTAIGNMLWPFGIFCGNLGYFSPFWYFGPRKIWQLCSELVNYNVPLKQTPTVCSHRLVRLYLIKLGYSHVKYFQFSSPTEANY
jgi:hypothetical protein